jgi:hypothetical protein
LALKREHPALQKIKFISVFIFLWVIFALLDPDPGIPLTMDPIRIWIYSSALNNRKMGQDDLSAFDLLEKYSLRQSIPLETNKTKNWMRSGQVANEI